MLGFNKMFGALAGLLTVSMAGSAEVPMAERREIGERKHRNVGRPLDDLKPEVKARSASLRRMLKSKSRR